MKKTDKTGKIVNINIKRKKINTNKIEEKLKGLTVLIFNSVCTIGLKYEDNQTSAPILVYKSKNVSKSKLVANNLSKDRIRLREKKTNKFKDFPLSDNAKSAIKEYLKTRNYNSNEPLFLSRKRNRAEAETTCVEQGVNAVKREVSRGNKGFLLRQQAYKIINDVAKSIGIKEKIGTHTLRKTFGYHAYNNGYDIAIIQKLFNHSTPAITLRYIGITQDEMDDVYLNLDL